MANHISSLKRARQTERKTAVNKANRTRVRNHLRTLREALVSGDAQQLAEVHKTTVSQLDKSVQKGVLHKNTASRYKSRLAARVKAAGSAPAKATGKAVAKKAAKKTAKA
jgi:small subunit ribosomal protein S20